MLTQCPECKTTFRLHLNQLKAAAGKVRCSRCHTTFDALDNLFEPARPNEERPPIPAPETTPEEPGVTEPGPAAGVAVTARAHTDMTGGSAKPDAAATIAVAEDDTLSAFIDELQESTSASNEAPLPLVGSSAARAVTTPDGPEAPQHTDLITTALHTPDAMPHRELAEKEGRLLLEAEDRPDNTVEAIAELEPRERGLLPRIEVDEPEQEHADSVEEIFGFAPAEEETMPRLEPVEQEQLPAETFEEIFGFELVEEAPQPRLEVEELEQAPADSAEEIFAFAPADEEILPQLEPEEQETARADTFEEILGFDSAQEETLPLLKPEEMEDTFEEILGFEPEAMEEMMGDTVEGLTTEPLDTDAMMDEPIVSDEALDAFFDEIEPEAASAAEETLFEADEAETGSSSSEADLDAFFAESVTAASDAALLGLPDQDALQDLFTAEPLGEAFEELQAGDEAAMDEIMLDEEVAEPEVPATPIAPSDPLEPFSAAQLETLLSPTEEQAAEEATVRKVSLYAPEELDLDSGDSAAEPLFPAVEEAAPPRKERPRAATPKPPAIDYALPAELTQARQGSTAAAVLWGLGVVLMCAALALQYLYYHRLQLVENPNLRPLLATMCELSGCALPPRRDLGQIELTEHLMQFHPNYEQSLMISATLVNRAAFPQPYPLVEVVMTDIEQRVVARRRFTPAQYLANHDGGNSFPANSEVPLLLEVLDPGNEAVGFEFRFY